MTTQRYKELIVWQKSIELVKQIYLLTNKLPKSELFGLTSQTRRASISIPSNIAEGYMRTHKLEYIHFLSISLGSAAELETQLILIQSLYPNLKETTNIINLLTEINKMLYVLIKKLKGTIAN